MTQNAPGGEGKAAPDVIRHAVLLGDALENISLDAEAPERTLVPQPRNPWKLTVLKPEEVLRAGRVRAIPADASHIALSLDGGWAIERSGLLRSPVHSVHEALDTLSAAADEFDSVFAELVAAVLETGLPAVVCTLVPSRYGDPSRQRVAATALAIFNDRVMRRAFAASLPIVDLRMVCDEDGDYAGETLLSRTGVRKAANVIRSALYEISRSGERRRVYF